jgi:hypothetical protein
VLLNMHILIFWAVMAASAIVKSRNGETVDGNAVAMGSFCSVDAFAAGSTRACRASQSSEILSQCDRGACHCMRDASYLQMGCSRGMGAVGSDSAACWWRSVSRSSREKRIDCKVFAAGVIGRARGCCASAMDWLGF